MRKSAIRANGVTGRGALAATFMLAALTGAAPRAALADPNSPTDDERASARALGTEGVQLAMNGDCKNAVDKLTRAEALVHAPTTAVPLGQCEIQLGKIVMGTELLTRIVNEPLAAGAPAPFIDAKARAQTLLAAAQPRIAKLRIHVDSPAGATGPVQVTLDGVPVSSALFDSDRLTDPGTHHLSARQGTFGADADVTLAEGQSRAVTLTLASGGGSAEALPTAAATAAPPVDQATASSASAPAPQDTSDEGARGLEFGVRLGVSLPFGSSDGDSNDSLSATASLTVPLWLEAGYRFDPHWYAGGYFQYAIGSLGSQFTDSNGALAQSIGAPCGQLTVSCSVSQLRIGLDAEYHVLPTERFDPWFGLGFGYEWLNGSISYTDTNNAHVSISLDESGFEFVNFQGGLDIRRIAPNFGLGPFLSLSVGEFGNQSSSSASGTSVSTSVTNKTLHEWLTFGVRGDYDIRL